MKSNIVLIGFMGTGKTAVGKALAERLGYTFVDTDQMIVESALMSVEEIFKTHGEPYFRKLESTVVKDAYVMENCVISTGGGTILDPENRKFLASSGKIILLTADPMVIARRVSKSGPRPILADSRYGNTPEERIRYKLLEREELYHGDLTIDTSDLTIEEVVERTLGFINCPPYFECLKLNADSGSYDIIVCSNMLDALLKSLKPLLKSKKLLIVTSDRVSTLWLRNIISLLSPWYELDTLSIPDGESYKSFESAMAIHTKALEMGLDRSSAILALGGGVIGDLAGFVASTYMRGIKVIQVPTTLLAQVDSSIGGKTGINHPKGKNIIGTFHQPSLVFSDVSFLMTLPKEELINGLAEVVKYAVLQDLDLFEYLEKHVQEILAYDAECLIELTTKCSYHKKRIVEMDEKESGIRAILNYGHTIGHGIEVASNFQGYRHGEAVAIGMVYANAFAVNRGLFTKDESKRVENLLTALGLPIDYAGLDSEVIFETLLKDKKNEGGLIKMILPTKIGSARLWDDVTQTEIRNVLKLS